VATRLARGRNPDARRLLTAANATIGTPSAPYDTGALLAITATRLASRSGMPPTVIRIDTTTEQEKAENINNVPQCAQTEFCDEI